MATIRKKISKRVVDESAPADRDLFIRDPELRGFGLKVTPKGGKTYFLEYRMGGRGAPKGRITIGRHGSPWTPDKARERAKELLELVRRGINPVAHKADQNRMAVDLAFRPYADLFVERYAKRHQTRSWQQAQRLLDRDIKPVLKDRPLHQISRREIKCLLEEMAERAPALSRYAHATMRKLFRWAVDRGDIERSPMSEMPPPSRVLSRERVLSHDELRAVWKASYSIGHPFGPMVRLLIATGQRREEVASLRWRDVHLEERLWTKPAERAKNGRAHLVPLNTLALEVLRCLPTGGVSADTFAFSTTGLTPPSGWSKAKARLDRMLAQDLQEHLAEEEHTCEEPALLEPWRLHDIRRTFATGLQSLGIRLEVTEAILNHVAGSRGGIVGVYQRHQYSEEKRAALDAWGEHVMGLVDLSRRASSVVSITREKVA